MEKRAPRLLPAAGPWATAANRRTAVGRDVSGIGGFAKGSPGKVALVSMARSMTFEELDERQGRLAGSLLGAGVELGDRVAVLSQNSVSSLEVTIGALRAGIVPVPINPLLTEPEARYILEDSGSRWLFTDRPVEAHPDLDRIVTFGDAYERLLAEAEPAVLCPHARGRPMHYTSGTTGVPKGVWVKPYGGRKAAQTSADFRSFWDLRSSDIHLVCSPLAHSAPHRYAMRTLEAGGTVALQSRFDPAETLAAMDLFNTTSTFMVPTHLERIFGLGERAVRRHDLGSMRALIHAGAPIRAETKRKAIEVFPRDSVWEFYGSTEGHATRISSEEWLRKPGSVGRPRDGARILVRDDDGRPVGSHRTGQIWVDDPTTERFSYWGDKIKTRRAWRDGAFTVGDLGYLDGDGYLFLVGRAHDIIITGGVNVYPQEVEAVLEKHPAVAEAAVFGIESDEWGQEVHAAVVVSEGPRAVDLEELRGWAREQLAGFKTPRAIHVVTELDRTPTGKLLRRLPEMHR